AAQFYVNRLSVGAAALLPSNIVLYATLAPDAPGRAAIANWLGAAVVIVLAWLVRMRLTAEPAATREAIVNAVELAAGCTALIVVTRALDLPRGNWAVLTLCLVLVPGARRTGRRVVHRALGTTAGALLAVAVAVVAPPTVCLLLAAVCAVLTVAYAVLPDDFLYAVFLTPTVLLLFSSGRADATVPIAWERVGMTALGAALALALTMMTMAAQRAGKRTGTA
ncbi:FUSC family protein, partial [Streptomyces albidoflavus]